MSPTQLLPILSSAIILFFAGHVFRRYFARGGAHLVVWGIGLSMFGVGSLAEAYSGIAWHPLMFRLWYLGGAILNAAWLGQGTVYLLRGQRLPNLIVSLAFGYALSAGTIVLLSRWLTLSSRVLFGLVFLTGLVFTIGLQRRWIHRWNPSYVTTALTVVLVVASLLASYMVFTMPVDGVHFDTHQTLSAQYREILPKEATVRSLTPIFNIYGVLTLVGGALYSTWLLWRKEIVPHRVAGNLLIAMGALSLALASTLVRFGLGDYLYLGELSAAVLMFAGFLLATMRIPVTRLPTEAEAS